MGTRRHQPIHTATLLAGLVLLLLNTPFVPAAAEGVIVGLLVDTSGTVRGSADEVLAAVRQLLEASAPRRNAEWFLVSFDKSVILEEDFTSDVETLKRALQNLIFRGGGTSFYDAVYLGVDKARSRPGTPKILIVFTDGRDKGSHYSHRELLKKLKSAGVKIHFVLFPSDDRMLPHLKPGPGEIRKRIDTIAAATGGKTFIAGSTDPLPVLIERLVDELCR